MDKSTKLFYDAIMRGCVIWPASCACGGRYAWSTLTNDGTYEMYGCICHNNPPGRKNTTPKDPGQLATDPFDPFMTHDDFTQLKQLIHHEMLHLSVLQERYRRQTGQDFVPSGPLYPLKSHLKPEPKARLDSPSINSGQAKTTKEAIEPVFKDVFVKAFEAGRTEQQLREHTSVQKNYKHVDDHWHTFWHKE